jgi:hypothetical protein
MGKASTRKRLAREEREALGSLRTDLQARGYLREGEWAPSAASRKISEGLVELINPYMDDGMDIVAARVLARIGALAWNLAVEPEGGENQRDELQRQAPPNLAADLDHLLQEMRQRKLELFPDDLRLIVQTDVHLLSDGGFFVTAAAFGNEDGSGRSRGSGSMGQR